MKRYILLAAIVAVPQVASAWPWSTDMMNQPSVKPQEPVGDTMQMYPMPARSIPVQGIPTPVANRDDAKALSNPVALSDASLKNGRDLYRIYCSACHGLTGKAESPVASKIGAIDLTDSYVQKELTEGWIFGTITFGSYVMPAYGVPSGNAEGRGSNDLSVEERWHVVNYVRNGLLKETNVKTAAAK